MFVAMVLIIGAQYGGSVNPQPVAGVQSLVLKGFSINRRKGLRSISDVYPVLKKDSHFWGLVHSEI
ncbi:hypothetical protein B9Z43_12000 [Limnohabitans sp. MMS-10A-192]|nr:hypothetical protein B9Z43_12000 [Limnohabitans sp. MMS-10A-192]